MGGRCRVLRTRDAWLRAETSWEDEASSTLGGKTSKIGKKKGPSRLGSAGAHKFSSGILVHEVALCKLIQGAAAPRKPLAYRRVSRHRRPGGARSRAACGTAPAPA